MRKSTVLIGFRACKTGYIYGLTSSYLRSVGSLGGPCNVPRALSDAGPTGRASHFAGSIKEWTMNKVLLVRSSISGDNSTSLALARDFLTRYPHSTLVERTLSTSTMPHLDAETFAAMVVPEAQRNDRQKALVALSDTLIAEVEAADTIVLAVPMYNFSIPSTLKAWIDHIARAGRTFRYSADGPEGLLKGKKVFVFTSRGGLYSDRSPFRVLDFQEPYLHAIFRFVGLDDVTFVHLEGLQISPEAAAKGRAQAWAAIEKLSPRSPATPKGPSLHVGSPPRLSS
jgi:FMN-dependent NADH-azoreductase